MENDKNPSPSSSLSGIPDGWKLVPEKMDVAMIAAWYRYKNGHRFAGEEPARDTSDVGAYAAMLAAAPAAPAPCSTLLEIVWLQNLKGFLEGKFHADERWRKIFIEQLARINAEELARRENKPISVEVVVDPSAWLFYSPPSKAENSSPSPRAEG